MATQPQEVMDTQDIQETRDYEAEARVQGWRPESEWPEGKPKPPKFKTAEEFILLQDESLGLKNKELDRYKQKVSLLERDVKRLVQAERVAYETALADLKAEAEAAVENADLDAFRKADGKMEALRKGADATHGENPRAEYEAFREANAWYDRANLQSASEIEVEARLYADRLADRYAQEGLTQELPPSEFFARIARETEAKFPLLTAKKTRERLVPAVEGVSQGRSDRNAKTGANLPPEAKRQAERFWHQKIIKGATLAEALNNYAKDYDWSAA